MRSSSPSTVAALAAARSMGIVPRRLVWLKVRDRSDASVFEVGLWSGDYPVSFTVLSGDTGLPVTRTYIGGVGLNVGDINRVSDLTIQSVDVSMSAIANAAQEIVRGYEPRLARVEIHTCLFDPATRQPADDPEVDFLGVVDGLDIGTAASGGESDVTLKVVSEAILMLSRVNPARRSDNFHRTRSGDRVSRYSSAVGNWHVDWGEVPKETKKR